MANFSLYVNSKFKPFSYQEMLAPALMATQAHQAIEEAYGDLNTQADAIGSLINETNDPVAAARYKSFETALRDKADSLAKNGLTTSSRKSLLDLRSKYSKDITPIQKAIERRRELADEQRKMIAQNPTLMYQRDLRTLSPDSSLDKFLENPDYDYGASYSGALLTQQVAQAASNLAKELTYYGSGKRLDAFTKTFMQQHGYTRNQVLDAINNPNRAESQPVLNSIVEQAIGASKVKDWGNSNIIDEAYNYARMGLWSAVGQSQVSQYEDYGAKLAAQEAMRRRAAQTETTLKGGYPLNPTPILSANEKKKFSNNLKNFSQYFYKGKNGQIYMNQKGLKEYYRTVNNQIGGKVMTTPEGTVIRVADPNAKSSFSNFRQFIDSIGGAKYFINGKMQPGNLGNLWSKYVQNEGLPSTATKRSEYITDIEESDMEGFKTKVLRAARMEGKLYSADMDNTKGKFVNTHNDLPLDKLVTGDYKVIAKANSAYGRTLFVLNTKTGETKRYFAPAGIHYSAENSSSDALYNMNEIEQVLINGKLNGKPLTNKQRAILEENYIYYSNMQGMTESQVGLDYSTPTKNNEPTIW